MKMEMHLLAGNESKQFLADLSKQIDRLEKIAGIGGLTAKPKTVATKQENPDDFETAASDTSSDDFGSDDFTEDHSEEQQASFDDFTNGEDDAPVAPKATKAPKAEKPSKETKAKIPTVAELNDACKARVKNIIDTKKIGGKEARDLVVKFLVKNFKTKSVADIAPEDRARAIAGLNGK